jgi:uncharacterized repeat protein (TIGR01451 family)
MGYKPFSAKPWIIALCSVVLGFEIPFAPSPADATQSDRADLEVLRGGFADPPSPGVFMYRVQNHGPDVATNVVLSTTLPPGTRFNRVTFERFPGGIRCTTPPFGGSGDIQCQVGHLAPNFDGYVHVVVEYPDSAPQGSLVDLTLSIASSTPDPDTSNNAFRFEGSVPVVLPPPGITSVEGMKGPNLPFTITIRGTNLLLGEIGIGCGCEPYADVSQGSSEGAVLRGGKDLKARFPKNVPIQICITNVYGKTAYVSFTR